MTIPYIDVETFNTLVNCIIASSKINTIKTPLKNYPYLRPNIHGIIYGRVGGTKSSMLYEICNALKIAPTTLSSKAGLIGAVDKNTGTFIPPIIWEYRNNILPVDEWSYNYHNTMDTNMVDILNTILENPFISKKLGYRCNEFNEIDKKDKSLYCNVKDSRIKIKTRFSLLMNTMVNLERLKSNQMTALVSRCLLLPLYPTLDDLKNKLNGKTFYTYEKFNVIKDITIKQVDWDFIKDFLYNKNIAEEYYLRTFGDIMRIFCILKEHNTKLYDNIINIKNIKAYRGHYGY